MSLVFSILSASHLELSIDRHQGFHWIWQSVKAGPSVGLLQSVGCGCGSINIHHLEIQKIPSMDWYIYLHLVDFHGFHVGKHTSPMDTMGYRFPLKFTPMVTSGKSMGWIITDSIHFGPSGNEMTNVLIGSFFLFSTVIQGCDLLVFAQKVLDFAHQRYFSSQMSCVLRQFFGHCKGRMFNDQKNIKLEPANVWFFDIWCNFSVSPYQLVTWMYQSEQTWFTMRWGSICCVCFGDRVWLQVKSTFRSSKQSCWHLSGGVFFGMTTSQPILSA